MPLGNEVLQIGVTAVNDGAKLALTESSAFNRARHWLLHREVSLTNPAEVAIFTQLYTQLKSFCASSEYQTLPRSIIECWERFQFKNVNNVYKFSSSLNFPDMLDDFERKRLINNTVYGFHPFTSAILSELAKVKSIRENKTQCVGKIFLSYVFSVALEVAGLKDVTEQYAAVSHLHEVIRLFRNDTKYRDSLDADAFEGLNAVYKCTTAFSEQLGSTLYLTFIPKALEQFAIEQKQVLITVFKTLLVLTEGGNKRKITSDYRRISRGGLSDKHESITFHPENPFRAFLMEVALRISDLFGSRTQQLEEIPLPSEEEIKVFLVSSLDKGVRIGKRRGLPMSNDSILYLLEQKTMKGKVQWVTTEDKDIINGVATHLKRLAEWLKLHVYAANVAADLNVLLSIEGQRWLAQGKEAKYIQSFMIGYKALLEDFQRDSAALHEYLSANIRKSGFGEEHDVLRLTNELLTHSVQSLMQNGIKPLQNIEARFLNVMNAVGQIRAKYFRSSAILNKEYGFNLPVFELEDTATRATVFEMGQSRLLYRNTINTQGLTEALDAERREREEAIRQMEASQNALDAALKKGLSRGLNKLIQPGLSKEAVCSGIKEVIQDACEDYAHLTQEQIVATVRLLVRDNALLSPLRPYIPGAQPQAASAVPVSGMRQAFFGAAAANATQGSNPALHSGLQGGR